MLPIVGILICNEINTKMLLLLFSAVLILSPGGCEYCECPPVPHPTCRFELVLRLLNCTTANLTIPDNFNVNSMPHTVYSLDLGCPNSSADHQCNVLRNDCQPIPFTQKLADVTLRGLRAEDEKQRPPVNRFLAHNKHQITSLTIGQSKLHYLDNEFFRGFWVLKYVSVVYCGIHSIALDTFQELTPPKPGFAEGVPLLKTIGLNGNALEQLDWSVLRPVKDSLVRFYAGSQTPGLKLLFRSGHEFTLGFLQNLDLSDNALTEIPKEVWRSLDPEYQSYIVYSFAGNNLCNKTDCSCCAIENFARWVKRFSAGTDDIAFSCGIPDKATINRASVNLDLGVYANCSKS